MNKTLTHGSLFAGVGGFELAAGEAGIVTKWNCEIEIYPRLVLAARFPSVKQYGDIRKLNGAEIEPVDIISFGSPCQSFSQAGGRQGLDGASGLFHEAVRVIREMREATGGKSPRFAIMENVPGIYSSKSSGKSDFREVLNELLKIKDKAIDVPLPKDGKFLTAGSVVGDGYSLAWRTLCSSKFGVAQRRRRMFLVVDFAGERASEVLSEQEGEGRDFTPGYLKGEGTAGDTEEGVGGVVKDSGNNDADNKGYSYNDNGYGEALSFEPGALKRMDKKAWSDKSQTIRAHMGDNQLCIAAPIDMRNATRTGEDNCGVGIGDVGDPAFTVTAEKQHAIVVESPPLVLADRKPCAAVTKDIVGAVSATDYKGAPVLAVPQPVDSALPQTMKVRCGKEGGGKGGLLQLDKSATLSCNNEQTLFEPYNICSMESNAMKSSNVNSGIYAAETTRTLDCNGGSPLAHQGGTLIAVQGNVHGLSDDNGSDGEDRGSDGNYCVSDSDDNISDGKDYHKEAICYQKTVGTLLASDYKGIRNQDIEEDKAIIETFGNNGYGKWNDEPAALKASGGDYPGGENLAVEKEVTDSQSRYAVRRLTPLECLRLQGLPDTHLDNIHISEPTDEQLEYWRAAWAELGKVKTDNQVRKFLGNPYSDSNAYKAIGNSLAVPCALWVMRGIVAVYYGGV